MVILKVDLQTEEVYWHTSNIIVSSRDDTYHVPIIDYGPFNHSLPSDGRLVHNNI